MIDNRIVGKTIAVLRQARGMTQQQLAAALNVSHQAVSKWENGAALPDIQTLMELTQLFGITMEQLLSGEIPEEHCEETGDDPLRHFGKLVGDMFNDIGNRLKPERKEEKAVDTEKQDGESLNEDQEQKVDLQKLLQMAPFMSKGAVEEMLKKCGRKLTAQEIARFAPFVDSACLETLIEESESEMSWETLRKLAPFLKKEMVDAFARAIALGEKYVRPAAKDVTKTAEDVCKNFDEVSRKIGRGVDAAVRKAVRFGENVIDEVSKAFDNLSAEPKSRDERRAQMRKAIFEKAITEEKWNWIEAHAEEIQDEELKRRICEKASHQGMHDWVMRNFGVWVNETSIDQAVADGKWEWLSENLTKFSPEMQRYTVAAALKVQNWTWLAENADQADLDDMVMTVAEVAYEAGEKMLAVQMVRYTMLPDELEAFASGILEAGDFDFVDMIVDEIPDPLLTDICGRLAEGGNWDGAKRYIERLDDESADRLMQIAIDAGDFDVIDALDVCIKNAATEQQNNDQA